MKKRVIIAGGGTGGHIFPAVAIANALKKIEPETELLFVGAKGRMEMEKIPEAGYKIEGIDIAGFNRSSLIKNLDLPFKLLKSFLEVRRIVRDFRPDAVIGVGGYSSFPVLRYAQAKGIPTFIHESNAFAGKANKMLGRKAEKIFVASEGMDKFFPAANILVTGNPVRAGIKGNAISREEGIRFFGLDPLKPTIFSTGGSLGAKSINEAIAEHIGEFEKNGIQLIWQTGKPFGSRARACAAGRENIRTAEFIKDMEYAFAAADLVISRSGAMSIAELCVVKKPVVFVPYPFAAEDHQTANAQALVRKKAGLMVRDQEANEKLAPTVIQLIKDEPGKKELIDNIGKLAVTNADEAIAKTILDRLAQ